MSHEGSSSSVVGQPGGTQFRRTRYLHHASFVCLSHVRVRQKTETSRTTVVHVRDNLVALGKALPFSTESHIKCRRCIIASLARGVISLGTYLVGIDGTY